MQKAAIEFSFFQMICLAFVSAVIGFAPGLANAGPRAWQSEWPNTDFSKTTVDFKEILSGGPPKDGIPSIDNPKFVSLANAGHIADTEPVVGVVIKGEARAYPLQVLMWHEIVNDEIAGVPITVTFCPLCNAAIVFDRRLGDQVLDFGTTGKLRNSDLVMYDRQTESWWQQFLGRGIVGVMTGEDLKVLPSRLESMARFKARAPQGKVLVPNSPGRRRYGANPYAYYDSMPRPFLYSGPMPEGLAPLARVVSVEIVKGDRRAWSLDRLRKNKRIETSDGLILTWAAGQNSALDTPSISEGMDVGNVVVQRLEGGKLVDVAYGVDFAFAFHAFYPKVAIQ